MPKPLLALLLLCPLPALGQDLTLPLTARGQEPGWRLEMRADALVLVTQDGAEVRASVTGTTTEGPVTVFSTDGLTARVEPGLCRDAMTGMPYPYHVQVTTAGRDLGGCGGAPALLLQGDWTVATVKGAATEAPAALRFDGDRISGNSGCNRFSGTVHLEAEGLTLSGIAMTRMACPPAQMRTEAAVAAALDATTRFDIAEDGALVLLAGDRPVLTALR